MADKMKSDLGSSGNFSTEQVFYLLLLTLQSKKAEIQHENDPGSNIKNFRAFIVRYLYFLRESRIVK